jgi:hypothetical protein
MKRNIFYFFIIFFVFYNQTALGIDITEVQKMTDSYLNFYKAGEPAKALELYWNWDAFCKKAFGQNYTSLTNSDKKIAQRLIYNMSIRIYKNNDVITLLTQAEFINREVILEQNGKAQFIYETIYSNNPSFIITKLYFEEINNKIWVVDLDYKGLLSHKIGAEYESLKSKMSLLAFLRRTNDMSSEMVANYGNEWLYGSWKLAYDPDHPDSPEEERIIFKRFGSLTFEDYRGSSYSGFYTLTDDKILLNLKIKNKDITMEMSVSADKGKLLNKTGAYYTKE